MSLQVSASVVEVLPFRLTVAPFQCEPGTLTMVTGKSGSGKSTLLQALAGFLPLSSGEIFLAGKRLDTLPPELRKMAMVFQKPALFPHLSVLGNVEFGLKLQKIPKASRQEQASHWLAQMRIEELASRSVHQLSGGQAQRVALARAFAVEFPVLLLDEPFSALDEDLKHDLGSQLKALVTRTQVIALMVSHDRQEREGLADQEIRVEAGEARVFTKR